MTRRHPQTTARTRTLALLAVALVVASGTLAGPVAAGDSPATFELVPGEESVEPGSTFSLDVVVFSDGGYGDVGIVSAAFTLSYDPDVATVESVEHGPYLEDEGVDVRTDAQIDNEAGLVSAQLAQDPTTNGSDGRDVLATMTVAVDENATDDAAFNFTENEIVMSNDVSWPYVEHNETVAVEGAGDQTGAGFDLDPRTAGVVAVAAVGVLAGVAVARRR